MKLYMKQQLFTWSDTFMIYDEQGQKKYHAQAEILSFGHQMHVYKYNEEIGFVSEKLFQFMPAFKMELRGEYLGEIIKRFTFFSQRYDLDYQNWHVEGDWTTLEYTLYDSNNNEIMRVDKKWLSWGDSYCLNIHEEQYEEICIMILIAIDCAMCNQ